MTQQGPSCKDIIRISDIMNVNIRSFWWIVPKFFCGRVGGFGSAGTRNVGKIEGAGDWLQAFRRAGAEDRTE